MGSADRSRLPCSLSRGRGWSFGWCYRSKKAQTVVRFSLGINSPFNQAFTFDPSTCLIDMEFEYNNWWTPTFYPMAEFAWYLNGFDSKGEELPGGLQSGMSCVLTGTMRRCSKRIVVHKAASFLFNFRRAIFTGNQAILAAQRQSDPSCADTPVGTCSSPAQTLDYTMRITEHKCVRAHGTFAPSSILAPLSQPGMILSPGAGNPYMAKWQVFYLAGVSRASWTVRTRIPMVVAAVTYSQIFGEPNELDPIAACQRTDTRGTCDMTKLAAVALPRSYCLGTQCSADIPVTPDQWDRVLFISYPGIWTYPRGPDFFYNATAWPPVLANIRLDTW